MRDNPQFLPPDDHESLAAEASQQRNQLPDELEFDPSAITQELTAYLDGELSPPEVARVEQRLNDDPVYLAEMQALQRTWDAFDAISSEEIGDSFMRSTMEMVVADAKSTAQAAVPVSTARYWRPVLAILIPLMLFCISYAATHLIQTEPHRRLTDNLSLIEHLDQYLKAKLDLDFLLKLSSQELFSEYDLFAVDALDDLKTVAGKLDGPQNQNQNQKLQTTSPEDRLSSMNLAEKQQLKLNFETYSKLSPKELDQVEKFHQQLNQHPDRVQLFSVLEKYYQWLTALGSTDKGRVLDSDRSTRLDEIAKLRSEQTRTVLGKQGATKLPLVRDEEFLLNWFDFTIRSNEPMFREQFPKRFGEYQRQQISPEIVPREQLVQISRQASLRQLVAALIRADRKFIEETIYSDFDLLKRGLSFEAQAIIADQDVEDQKTLILNWIETSIQSKAIIPEEKLQEFYEKLPADRRDQLDQMSIEEWKETLSRMYREQYAAPRIDEELLFPGDFYSGFSKYPYP
jgi:hypothetical protein